MLTQGEADALLAMGKSFVGPPVIALSAGADETHDLMSDDGEERFLLDVARGVLRMSKLKFQTRARKIVILARLDVDGHLHTNPDGIRLPRTHLHRFREGYDDKFAEVPDPAIFPNLADPAGAIENFLRFCNVTQTPTIQVGIV